MDQQQIDPAQLLQIIELVRQHAWVPLASLVIWFAIRVSKSDTKLPWTIPPRVRIAVVIGLGVASGVLQHVTDGQTWLTALTNAGLSVLFAVLFHEGVIESIRDGHDIVLPGLIIPGLSPSPTAPVTVPIKATTDTTTS